MELQVKRVPIVGVVELHG